MSSNTVYSFRPITHISTSPYRQIIGEKNFNASIGKDSNPKRFVLINGEYPKVHFDGGLKVLGINFVTAITNHPCTSHDAYIISEKAAKKPLIEFYGSCKVDKKPIEIFDKYDNITTKTIKNTIHYHGKKNLELGDKISNLHGQKGTITEIFDNKRFTIEREIIENDLFECKETKYKKPDILMNFDSIIKRGAFGIFAEIGYEFEKEQPTITSSFKPIYTGKLYDNITNTYHDCIVGNLHFMILDKLSSFIINKQATIDLMTKYNILSRNKYLYYKLKLWQIGRYNG